MFSCYIEIHRLHKNFTGHRKASRLIKIYKRRKVQENTVEARVAVVHSSLIRFPSKKSLFRPSLALPVTVGSVFPPFHTLPLTTFFLPLSGLEAWYSIWVRSLLFHPLPSCIIIITTALPSPSPTKTKTAPPTRECLAIPTNRIDLGK